MKRTLFLLVGVSLYLTLSGFQCASTQMSTAKVALQGKDYKKAESSFKEELAVRPENSEAWYLLGTEIYFLQRRYSEMHDAFARALKATTPPLTEAQVRNLYIYDLQAWLDLYNGAGQASRERQYDLALRQIDTAILLRPEIPQNYVQQGAILISSGATEKALDSYREYIKVVGSDITKGIGKGMFIGMTEKELKAKLGAPDSVTKGNEIGEYAAMYPDNLYVYIGPSRTGTDKVVVGWTYFSGEKLPHEFKGFTRGLSGYPYYRLGVEAYGDGTTNPKKYDEALEMLRVVEQFDPTQADVGSLIAQIYIDAGRESEARSILDKRLKEDPKNPKVYINYSILLHNAKDYNGATEMLKKVLNLGLENDNPSYRTALFNLGVYYKNWGKYLQDSLEDVSKRLDAAQEELFAAKLRESLTYFERLRTMQSDQTDYGLLAELGNLYYVLGQDDKLQKLAKDFEALQKTMDVDNDGQYWREMSKLYASMGEDEKAMSAGAKAKALGR